MRVEIGDSAFRARPVAGGSMGTASWGTAGARCGLRAALREDAAATHGVAADTAEVARARASSARAHAFGAQFAEVRVDADTGEVRVPRMLGVFAAGRIINPRTARSQLIGGMTMGLVDGAARGERHATRASATSSTTTSPATTSPPTPTSATSTPHWIDEPDDHLNPMGTKGIGEIGIVGAAAAIANAVYHATGVRVRDLPIRLDRVLRAD